MAQKTAIVVNANKSSCRTLCQNLESLNWTALPCFNLNSFEKTKTNSAAEVVLLDPDTIEVNSLGKNSTG